MKNFLKSALTICLLLCFALALTACGNNAGTTNTATFACANKTFVYDKCEPNTEMSEEDFNVLEAMAQVFYGHTTFVFDATNCTWDNPEDENPPTLQGTWEIVDNTVVVTTDEESSETLHIVGLGFYISTAESLNVYFKLAA